MSYFRIGSFSSSDTASFLTGFLIVLIVVGICAWFGYFWLKTKDNSKPLKTAKVKILEKPVQQGNIEWYVVEFENGERKRLRNFHGTTVLITVGDEGIIEYQGITIQSFRSLSNKSI